MGNSVQITETMKLSTKGRSNFMKLIDGLPIHYSALRELMKKGCTTKDAKPVPAVVAEYLKRFPS